MPDRLPGQGGAGDGALRDPEGAAAQLRQLRDEREAAQEGHYQRQEREDGPVRQALLPVLRRLRGLRGDHLHQAGDPAVRQPHVRGQRLRLLLRLRRCHAHDALLLRQPGLWTLLGAVPVRRQRGVRLRLPAGPRVHPWGGGAAAESPEGKGGGRI